MRSDGLCVLSLSFGLDATTRDLGIDQKIVTRFGQEEEAEPPCALGSSLPTSLAAELSSQNNRFV